MVAADSPPHLVRCPRSSTWGVGSPHSSMRSTMEPTTTDVWTPLPGSPQARALAHVTQLADGPPLDSSLRVTLHFHPDRVCGHVPILAALAADGLYRSQFETGISNGWLDPAPGGSRWRWESHIFAGAYDDAPPTERPKYGALNYRRRPTGGSTRFGSSHFRLRSAVLTRCTFCFPDSSTKPTRFGVAARMSLITEAFNAACDPLDDHIEAQVHGPVRLASDVEALVLDPSYRDSEVEAFARRLPCAVEWHPGFLLSVETLRQHQSFRGPEFVDLGVAIARDGYLTPRMIGDAARTGNYELQNLKKVWHYLARFGNRAEASDAVTA